MCCQAACEVVCHVLPRVSCEVVCHVLPDDGGVSSAANLLVFKVKAALSEEYLGHNLDEHCLEDTSPSAPHGPMLWYIPY